ncbi:MAG: LytR C-terminal domain-containing protein [Pseudomonadota bacterium]
MRRMATGSLIGLLGGTLLAPPVLAGPTPLPWTNLQGGIGAGQLPAGETAYHIGVAGERYRYPGAEVNDGDVRLGFEHGLNERVQLGWSLPWRLRDEPEEQTGMRHLRADLRLRLGGDETAATALQLWGTALEAEPEKGIGSGDTGGGAALAHSGLANGSTYHVGLGWERRDYVRSAGYLAEDRYFLQWGVEEPIHRNLGLTLEFEAGQEKDAERSTFRITPGLRYAAAGGGVAWQIGVGFAPDADRHRPERSLNFGISWRPGARERSERHEGLRDRLDRHEARLDRHRRQLDQQARQQEQQGRSVQALESDQRRQDMDRAALAEEQSRLASEFQAEHGTDEAEPNGRVVLRHASDRADRAGTWADWLEERGFEVEQEEVAEMEHERSWIRYPEGRSEAAVELGHRLPGVQEVVRHSEDTDSSALWLELGADLDREPGDDGSGD